MELPCWIKHRWSNWFRLKKTKLPMQAQICEKCNKVKLEVIHVKGL